MRAAGVCALLLAACAARQKMDLKTAQADLAAGRAGDAQHEFEEILRDDPRELAAIRGRVEAARKGGGLGALAREAQDAVSARPGDALAWYFAGLVAFGQGDEAQAVTALRKAATLQPREGDIQYRLGVALLQGEKFVEAREPLSQAAQLGPRVARYRPPLALCLWRNGDRKAAIDALRGFTELSPSPDEAALAVKTARSITDLFRDVPPAARAELEAALGFLSHEAPGVARPQLEALLARLPDLPAAHALLGLAEARLDESGHAVTELRRAAELAPDLPQPHAWLAELFASKDRADLASVEYTEAIARNPLDPEVLRHLGELRLTRALPGALPPLREAAVLLPEDDSLQLLLARAELAAGEPAPARGRLERLSKRRPDDPEVLLRLAMLLFDDRARADTAARDELGRKIEKLLEKVLTLQPENAAANRLLGALRAG